MSYEIIQNPDTKKNEIVISGFENGIAPSPHQGLANLKNVNTSTETGEIMCSFNRTLQSQLTGTGTFTRTDSNTVSVSGITLLAGSWVHITSDSGTGLSGDYYYLGSGKLSRRFMKNLGSSSVTYPVNTLVVGGGAGGAIATGARTGGGGGGGGKVTSNSALYVTPQAYSITVGTGGTADNDGTSSIFSTITSVGGAHGTVTGGTSGSGNVGGNGSGTVIGGGGGGNSAVGGNFSGTTGGAGGAGTANTISGASVTYGGGGGGGSASGTGGAGTDGGGAGGTTNQVGSNGAANRGSGGGGGANQTGGTGSDGVVVISYSSGAMNATGGTITTSGGNMIHTFTTSGTFTVTNLTTGNISAGTATFSVYSLGQPVQSTSEVYFDSSNATQYRYYILDNLGQLWVQDTGSAQWSGVTYPTWFMTEVPSLSSRTASGLAVLNGWVTITFDTQQYWKPTSELGVTFVNYGYFTSKTFHATLVGHQGKLYATDGTFVTSQFPNTSLLTSGANIQSNCSYTASSTTGTIVTIIGGSLPTLGLTPSNIRIPVVFYTEASGSLPTAITAGTIYYTEIDVLTPPFQFNVYAAASGGAAINIQTGAVGNQYFSTFYPLSGGDTTVTISHQRVDLPYFEVAQCLVELGNNVLIGGKTGTIYPWDQISALPFDIIPLPELNIVRMINVNNTAYVFAGQKGTIYVTNGSSISVATKVPDYCAGIAGTPSSYIEPYFTWGDAMFVRGQIFFSILDQTATKAGNCGGIWSFTPTQNMSTSNDYGIALKLQNQSSYATYNGVCTVLLPSYAQTAISPQYYSGWYSSISTPTYGIDFTDTVPGAVSVIETELIPTGTMLQKMTFSQIEYKLSTPVADGETVSLAYRQNSTDSFTSCGTSIVDSATSLSGYVQVNFERGQWIQLQITQTPLNSASSSFIRLKEIRIR